MILLIFLCLQWQAPTWSDRIEAWSIDRRFALRGPELPHNPIIIIAIDEASIQMLGDLQGENVRTWPRARWAELVRRVAAGEPRLIGLDVIFDTPGWDEGGDSELATALLEANNVVLPANLEWRTDAGSQTATYSPPIALLASAARGVGLGTLTYDVDGAARRLTLLTPWGGKSQPAFALVLATFYAGAPIKITPDELGTDLSLPLRFRGPEGTFHTVPLHELWLGETTADVFHDAIVLIGFTTQLEQDRHLAPFSDEGGMPGVEIQANALDTLLAGDWLRSAPPWAAPVALLALGLWALVSVNLGRPATGIALLLIGIASYIGLGLGLFLGAGTLLPLTAPVVTALLIGTSGIAERVVFAEREKRLMRQRFAGIMSAERVNAVMQNWDELRSPQHPPREAAVLFADIRGFTAATELLMSQGRVSEMAAFLSAYIDAMSEVVFAEGGVIYRMFGDGLLILFGLPEPLEHHALHAACAAVSMARQVEPLSRLWPLQETHPLGMGIGVNVGLMMDAIVGQGRRLDYSVIGDSVNTAARIESHCKAAMEVPRPPGDWDVPETVTILLGAPLFKQVKDAVIGDESVPPFEARGKADPVRVVRLLGIRTNWQEGD